MNIIKEKHNKICLTQTQNNLTLLGSLCDVLLQEASALLSPTVAFLDVTLWLCYYNKHVIMPPKRSSGTFRSCFLKCIYHYELNYLSIMMKGDLTYIRFDVAPVSQLEPPKNHQGSRHPRNCCNTVYKEASFTSP